MGPPLVQFRPDGVSYHADSNSFVILLNRFIGVTSNGSPTTWDSDMKIINEDVSTNPNNQCIIISVLEIPEIYHRTLKSNCKQLDVKLITNENLSEIYQIAFENETQNLAYFAVNNHSVILQLTIVKKTLFHYRLIQNGLRLEALSEQINDTVFNHIVVQICLQDVETNNSIYRRSYPYSVLQSIKLIVNEPVNMLQGVYAENIELQQNNTMMIEMTGKHSIEDGESLVGLVTLPMTEIFKKTKT